MLLLKIKMFILDVLLSTVLYMNSLAIELSLLNTSVFLTELSNKTIQYMFTIHKRINKL